MKGYISNVAKIYFLMKCIYSERGIQSYFATHNRIYSCSYPSVGYGTFIYTYTFMPTHTHICIYTKSRSLSLLYSVVAKLLSVVIVFRNLRLNRIL